jgi:hypothetical protein
MHVAEIVPSADKQTSRASGKLIAPDTRRLRIGLRASRHFWIGPVRTERDLRLSGFNSSRIATPQIVCSRVVFSEVCQAAVRLHRKLMPSKKDTFANEENFTEALARLIEIYEGGSNDQSDFQPAAFVSSF